MRGKGRVGVDVHVERMLLDRFGVTELSWVSRVNRLREVKVEVVVPVLERVVRELGRERVGEVLVNLLLGEPVENGRDLAVELHETFGVSSPNVWDNPSGGVGCEKGRGMGCG